MKMLGPRWPALTAAICLVTVTGGLPLRGETQTLTTLVNRVTVSVAFVLTKNGDGRPAESGSAFVAGDGVLITALHVVEDAGQISVQFPPQPPLEADVIGIDTAHDLALLAPRGPREPGPAPLVLGDSRGVQLGQAIAVVGYPLTTPDHPTVTVSEGIVSALRAEPEYVQIDAPVNPGDSGGPVLTSDGRVIGIVVASLREAQNFNFAIPIDRAKALLAEPRGGPLALPLTSPVDLVLEHSGNAIGPRSHEEQEGISCVPPPSHAAALRTLRVEMRVQKPLHMMAWLSWKHGAPPEDPGIFAQIDDTVSPELARPLTHLDVKPDTICLNYIAWNETTQPPGRTFEVKYTLGYRVFHVSAHASRPP
jgi:S1-C subfamily serine protease